MRLKQIEVNSFKGVRRAVVPVRGATVLVGANNAGKSSILQAIHFATCAMAQASEANKQSTISISELEYLPTNSYRELGFNSIWGNARQSPESRVSFTFEDDETVEHIASVRLKSARNEGLSVDPTIPYRLFPYFRPRDRPFTAYIPGIAGIPLEEQFLTRRLVFKKAASGDSNVVLRNILYRIAMTEQMPQLLSFVRGVYRGVYINTHFDENKDLHLNVTVKFPGREWRPLEFAGTGFLHVLQVFAYLILFRPSILLIDEPESHLHPTLQTRLTRQLRQRVEEMGSFALITTHSPFVARGLPLGSNVVWVKSGGVTEANESELIKSLLGWGALDKPILLCTEDSNSSILEEIIQQVPDLDNQVSVFPFNGVSTLGHGSVLAELKDKLGNQHTLMVHRDRDGLTDDELASWRQGYLDHGIVPWVTRFSDLEAYFCQPAYVASLYEFDEVRAQQLFDEVIDEERASFEQKFANKRKEINRRYEKTGGSPVTSDLIESTEFLCWIRGKDLRAKLRAKVRSAEGVDEKLIGKANEGHVVANDLIELISKLLN